MGNLGIKITKPGYDISDEEIAMKVADFVPQKSKF
jgi:hypothetical protein